MANDWRRVYLKIMSVGLYKSPKVLCGACTYKMSHDVKSELSKANDWELRI